MGDLHAELRTCPVCAGELHEHRDHLRCPQDHRFGIRRQILASLPDGPPAVGSPDTCGAASQYRPDPHARRVPAHPRLDQIEARDSNPAPRGAGPWFRA